MTAQATLILHQLETVLQGISGVGSTRVFRSLESQALPSTTEYPVILLRPLRNRVVTQLGADTRVALEIGIEGRVLASTDPIDTALDSLLNAIRSALNLGEFRPLAGLVRPFSIDDPGVSLGEAQYLFPETGERTAAVQMVLTCRYVERY